MSLADLEAYINLQIPVIILIQAWKEDDSIPWANDWDDGHYVVVIGYDARINYIYLLFTLVINKEKSIFIINIYPAR